MSKFEKQFCKYILLGLLRNIIWLSLFIIPVIIIAIVYIILYFLNKMFNILEQFWRETIMHNFTEHYGNPFNLWLANILGVKKIVTWIKDQPEFKEKYNGNMNYKEFFKIISSRKK